MLRASLNKLQKTPILQISVGLSGNIRCVECVVYMEGMRRFHEVLARIPEEKRSVGTSGLSGMIIFKCFLKQLPILPEVFSRLPQF
jgi:hypothetical protein